jgi:hypothetical protein
LPPADPADIADDAPPSKAEQPQMRGPETKPQDAEEEWTDDELDARPTVLRPNPDGVPRSLTDLPRWVLWRNTHRINRKTGRSEWTKPPISYHTGKRCDVTDQRNWATFAQVSGAKGGAWDGFGITLGEITDQALVLIGADFDMCLDDDGILADWAMPFLVAMGSHADRSPGGRGVKCLAFVRVADLPAARKLLDIPEGDRDQARTRTFGERGNGQHALGVQLFLGKRYFTITGHRWAPSPDDVAVLTLGQIATLAALFGPKTQKTAATASDSPGSRNNSTEEPAEAAIRARLQHAFSRHPALNARWDGGTEGMI